MLRFALFFVFAASAAGFAQEPPPIPGTQAPAAAAPQTVSEQVAEAEAAIVKSDWKTAQAKLEPWLAAHPDDARALFDAGYVADAQNRLEDAAGLYQRAVAANPKSFEARTSLGLLLARQGKLEDARPELTAATTLDPGDAGPLAKARVWRALAEIDRANDAERASNELLEALKLSPETEADTLLAASLADKAGQDDAAEKAYRRILAQNPKSAPANAGLAHLLIARKQFSVAEPMLRAALEKTPGDPALTAQLATVLAAQNDPEAVPLLEKLHDAHPSDTSVSRMLAEVLAEAGDNAGSERLYSALLAANPADPALLVAHGQNLIRLRNYSQAFETFDKVTQIDSANTDAWSGLAFAASQTNKPSITLHALTMRSKYLPEVPSTYFLWATSYDMLHKQAAAASYYRRFLETSGGKFPDQEFQARQRLILLGRRK